MSPGVPLCAAWELVGDVVRCLPPVSAWMAVWYAQTRRPRHGDIRMGVPQCTPSPFSPRCAPASRTRTHSSDHGTHGPCGGLGAVVGAELPPPLTPSPRSTRRTVSGTTTGTSCGRCAPWCLLAGRWAEDGSFGDPRCEISDPRRRHACDVCGAAGPADQSGSRTGRSPLAAGRPPTCLPACLPACCAGQARPGWVEPQQVTIPRTGKPAPRTVEKATSTAPCCPGPGRLHRSPLRPTSHPGVSCQGGRVV